jgi:superfamily II DNA/RNA helicase
LLLQGGSSLDAASRSDQESAALHANVDITGFVLKDRGRFRVEVQDTVTPERPSREVASARVHIVDSMRSRASSIGFALREEEWQIKAAADLVTGTDVMVITATGSGKTMCFYLAAISRQDRSFLVICPLLSLMADQVRRATELNIKACAINMESISTKPGLLKAVQNGDYELIYASPEWCQPHNKDFTDLCASSFGQRCAGIVIDEAHLCHAWRSFRPRYECLAILRSFFPNVGIMALSATMTPYVRRFVHETLSMMRPTRLIHRAINRPNIFLTVAPITKGVMSFQNLDFLVRGYEDGPIRLFQTIVFMDSRKSVCDATDYLWTLLPHDWIEQHPLAVAELSTALSDERRERVLHAMRSGECRILVATEVAGMGVDFPTVERVIQWTIPTTLSLSTLWQRFGRCARAATEQGVAILFHTKSNIIPDEPSHPLFALRSPAAGDGATVKSGIQTTLKLVEDFAAGRPGPSNTHDALEEPLANNDEMVERSYDPGEQRQSVQDDTTAEPADNMFANTDTSQDDNEAGDEDPEQLQRPTTRANVRLPKSCRGILWFLNTTGCRRAAVLLVFDEPGFKTQPDVLSDGFPCCDYHTKWAQVDSRVFRLLPPIDEVDGHAVDTDDDDPPDARPNNGASELSSVTGRKYTPSERKVITSKFQAIRDEIWSALGYRKHFSPFPSTTLLSDKIIDAVVRRMTHPTTAEQALAILTKEELPQCLYDAAPRFAAATTASVLDVEVPQFNDSQRKRKTPSLQSPNPQDLDANDFNAPVTQEMHEPNTSGSTKDVFDGHHRDRDMERRLEMQRISAASRLRLQQFEGTSITDLADSVPNQPGGTVAPQDALSQTEGPPATSQPDHSHVTATQLSRAQKCECLKGCQTYRCICFKKQRLCTVQCHKNTVAGRFQCKNSSLGSLQG